MKVLTCLLILFANFLPAQEARKSVKLLTIGNSFADNATEYLSGMAKAAGKDLLMFKANPGGCTLERHAAAMRAFELNPEDPKGQLYGPGFVPAKSGERKTNSLQQALDSEKWDYVTIQQYSNDSYKYETFESPAKELIECIHKHAPQAEIVIFQTWAYRQDYPGFTDGKFTQQRMFDQIVAAYAKLGAAYHLRIIPIGTAIQKARELPRWTFKFPDPNFNYQQPLPNTKPDQAGSLNVGWTIAKSEKAGDNGESLVATLDFKHCNAEGKYLGASVLYGFVFNEKVAPLTFVAPGVAPADAATLRGIADQVLAK